MQDDDNSSNNNNFDSEPVTQDAPVVESPVNEGVQIPVSSQPQQPPYAAQPQPTPPQMMSAYEQPVAEQPEVTLGAPVAVQKSKKKWLVPVIIGGAVVLLAGGASALFFGVYQNPKNVLFDAFAKLATAKAVQSKTVITLNKNYDEQVTFKNITLDTASVGRESGKLDATINLEYKGTPVAFGAKAVLSMNDNTLYFQVNDVTKALEAVAKAADATDELSDDYLDALKPLQNQWVKVTVDDVKKQSQSAGKDMECVVNVLKKQTNENSAEVAKLYKENPFIVVKDSLGVKDGRLGYTLSFDETKSKAFGDALEQTQAVKDLKACNVSGAGSTDTSDTIDSATSDDTTYTVWIDQWSHHLQKVEVSGTAGTGSDATNISGTIDFGYDTAVTVDIPTDAISIDEYAERIQTAMEDFGLSDTSMFSQDYDYDYDYDYESIMDSSNDL